MSARDTSGSAPQHSHPHNNTMSRNEKFWVDQVTPPPPGRTTRGGEQQRGGILLCNVYQRPDLCGEEFLVLMRSGGA